MLHDYGADIWEYLPGATYYSSCVALIQAFSELKFYPKSLAVAACVGDPKLYNAVGKDLRWLSGPTQVCA